MKKAQMKQIAKRADQTALKIDVCLIALDRVVMMTKEDCKRNNDEGMYIPKLLKAVESLLNEEIGELFQMKHDINKMLKKRK